MKLFPKLILLLCLAACETVSPTPNKPAQSDDASPQIQVMVLGTYHMAGSTSDVIGVDGGSVLTPERQAQLAELASSIAAFQPTVVVTERVTEAPEYIDPYYAEFDDEALATNENERVQVAFRIAKAADVSRVYGIDEQPSDGEPDYFPFGKLMAHLEATGQAGVMQAMITDAQAMSEEFMAETADLHIAERLLKVNEGPLSSPEFYYRMAQFDVGEDQPAAELQAYWFMRNAKIWSKLLDVVKPGDRVFIVYGAGHKFWIEHFVQHTPGFELVDPAPYLQSAFAD